jgi:hypothetical protein
LPQSTIYEKAQIEKKEKEEEKKNSSADDEIMKLKVVIEDMKKGY